MLGTILVIIGAGLVARSIAPMPANRMPTTLDKVIGLDGKKWFK